MNPRICFTGCLTPRPFIAVPVFQAQEYEDLELYNNNYEEYAAVHDATGSSSGDAHQKLGYSRGSGLRSIAEGSANSANNAVNNQDAAGHQAAYVAKNTLAQAAGAVSL